MKKGLLYAIIAVAAIVIVASFNMQLITPTKPDIPESMVGNVLYVCPAADSMWDSISRVFHPFSRYIIGGFFFVALLLLFGWGWQLYQNLLSDKFKRESFKTIWGFTKIWFWALIIVMLLFYTPNAFRRVSVNGLGDNWVMCEESNYNKIVPANAVHAR